jgi:poly(ADP-ribose) glycohydrolase ARH3
MTRPLYSAEKCQGVLLGTFVGDALGRPFEGIHPARVARALPFIDSDHETMRYTDDTQMAISVFEEMLAHGAIDKESLRDRFRARFDPMRGYGAGMYQLVEQWDGGVGVDQAAREQFGGEGSFGNGAAMRVAPVALFSTRNEQAVMLENARYSAEVTHTHPLGIQGAQLQAYAVLQALNDVPEDEWLPGARCAGLAAEFLDKLTVVQECLREGASAATAAERIGNGIAAIQAVPAALFGYLSAPHDFSLAVRSALSLGGDTDTIAAMTGAIAGARHGGKAIPSCWRQRLENGHEGVDFIVGLCRDGR